MSVIILHLSDIHIADDADPVLAHADAIAACTFAHLPEASQIFILVSGDIAFSGQESQFVLANSFLNRIRDLIGQEKQCPVNFVLCPGNHDCDFRLDDRARQLVLKGLGPDDEIDESVIRICTAVQSSFFTFRRGLENGDAVFDDNLLRATRYQVSDKTIVFECVNDSWTSTLNDAPGSLPFSLSHFLGIKTTKADLRVIVLHHPIHWLAHLVYRDLRTFIRERASIIFTGHEHRGNVGVVDETESGLSAFVEGCPLQLYRSMIGSSFNVIEIDLETTKFRSTRYKYDSSRYTPVAKYSWGEYHDLPSLVVHRFPIEAEFANILDDSGAPLKHPAGVNITLGDIYVYPLLSR